MKRLATLLITVVYLAMASASANSLETTSPISGSTLTTPPNSVTITTKAVLIPEANAKDLQEIPANVKDGKPIDVIDS